MLSGRELQCRGLPSSGHGKDHKYWHVKGMRKYTRGLPVPCPSNILSSDFNMISAL